MAYKISQKFAQCSCQRCGSRIGFTLKDCRTTDFDHTPAADTSYFLLCPECHTRISLESFKAIKWEETSTLGEGPW